jgi:hypothetical protein
MGGFWDGSMGVVLDGFMGGFGTRPYEIDIAKQSFRPVPDAYGHEIIPRSRIIIIA